ncbi:MAG: GNAT family N-acetyltransferase [bacterium]|nr:GNAT family N-acetyltransferase [bacterium]
MGAFITHELVGVVGLQREQARKLSHKAYIWGMYVAPHARRAGVGRALVAHALSYAKEQLQVRRVSLGVNALNPAAIGLYEHFGFQHAVLRQSKGF